MIEMKEIPNVSEDRLDHEALCDRQKTFGHAPFLSLDEEGNLAPDGNHTPLTHVANVVTAPMYRAVSRELGACLVLAEALKLIAKDPAFKKLGPVAKEEAERALAAIL